MKKYLMISTGMLAFGLLFGQIFFPGFPLVWMASNEATFVFIRAAIVILLTMLVFREVIGITLPRYLLVAGAAGLYVLAFVMTMSDQLYLADGVIFIETAIVLSLELLEAPRRLATPLRRRPVGRLGVGNDFVKIS